MINEVYLNNLIHAVKFVNSVRDHDSLDWFMKYDMKIVGIDRLSDSDLDDSTIGRLVARIRQRNGDPVRLVDTIDVFDRLLRTGFFSKFMKENNYDRIRFMISPTSPLISVTVGRRRNKFIRAAIRKLNKWLKVEVDLKDRREYRWENYGIIRYDFGFIRLEDQDQYLTIPDPEPELSSKEILEKVLKESSKTQ